MSTPTPPDAGSSEPLLFVGLVTGSVTAAMTLLVQFGIELTDGQTAAIVGLVSAVGVLVTAVWGRSKVFSPATVARMLAAAGRPAKVTAEADNTTVTTEEPAPKFTPGRSPVYGEPDFYEQR